MPAYVPLWVKSNFSFLEGASHPEELVEQAHAMGLPAMAITDIDGVYGLVRAHMRARELAFHLIVGAEVTFDLKPEAIATPEGEHATAVASAAPATLLDLDHTLPTLKARGEGRKNDVVPHIGQQASPRTSRVVLLCQDRHGYGNLCQLISKGRARGDKGESLCTLTELAAHAQGLIALCADADALGPLHAIFSGDLYALLARHLTTAELPLEAALQARAQVLGVPTVASTEVLYHSAARKPLQDVLTCIQHGKLISEAGRSIRANAEHDLKSPHVMAERFADTPEALARTIDIARRCRFSLSEINYRYPAETLPDGSSEMQWLRDLTLQGAETRFRNGVPQAVTEQIARELSLIETLEYGGYFLTMWEIVQFCHKENILCQGRGSAANSVVCYCLGITAVDPIKMDLLFERFLSLERAEPPDIDLDIEHQRREEVIQWVYGRYDRRHAAMVANVIRYRMRSAMRDVGKVLGLPLTALDRLSKLLGGRFSDLGNDALIYAGLDPEAPIHHFFLRLVDEIQDFPRHLSIHPGGFLLGHEPVDTLVAIEPATMKDRTVIQWDKYAVEDLGLFKVDLLGLGALSQIHRCFDLLKAHYDVDMDMASVPHDDPKTFAMISRGDTIGVFQIESRAQMSMLPRLQPKTFYDLVIEVAIVRPGPIQGDMVHPYLKRRSGEESADYPHPALRRVLEKTLGVPIFQEQVMKIAVLVGGYTPGEADQLRRDMAAWKSSGRIERHRERLVQRMIHNGITPEFAERIFSQIRGFGEYGFPESHAASFALIAYVTAYLRCHYPSAFTCSLLNAQPMGFYSAATLVEDAKRHGVGTLPIDVNHSHWDCTLEPATTSSVDAAAEAKRLSIRMGLRYVKGFGIREEVAFKDQPAPYRDLSDLIVRTRLPLRSYLKLAQAGALTSLVDERRDALWQVREAITRVHDRLQLPAQEQSAPAFAALSPAQQVQWDYRESHHSTRGHPLQPLRKQLDRMGLPRAVDLNRMRDGTFTRFVGMTICRQRPGTASGVTFYTLEDETGFVNLVVWRNVFENYSIIARTALLLGATGKVQSDSGVIHLVVDKLWEPELPFSAPVEPRNFH